MIDEVIQRTAAPMIEAAIQKTVPSRASISQRVPSVSWKTYCLDIFPDKGP
jgi:hypothetical protein